MQKKLNSWAILSMFGVLTIGLSNLSISKADEPDQFHFSWIGEVGDDSSAQGVEGVTYGNTSWRLNGDLLPAGTTIRFDYTIDADATDVDPSSSAGRFEGGAFTVSIPSMGINSVASAQPYVLLFRDDFLGTDSIQMRAADNTGLATSVRWDDAVNPFNDVNQLEFVDPVPPTLDIIGTSPNSVGNVTLANGDILSCNVTELLATPQFCQEEVVINPLRFSWTGEVGDDPLAQGVEGVTYGNTSWRLNGDLLPAGTTIRFDYTIDADATDVDPSSSAGRFEGGAFTVSIPSMGIDSVASAQPYVLLFREDFLGTDNIQMRAADNTGFATSVRWDDTVNPFNDVNQLEFVDPVPPTIDIIGTSPNSVGNVTLANGDILSCNVTELLANPQFDQQEDLSELPPIRFTWSGEVGEDPNAVDFEGIVRGNTNWSFNGTPLSAGTEIRFSYIIDADVMDQSGSSTTGRFPGGVMTVSIPSQGIFAVETVESYSLEFVDFSSVDVVRLSPDSSDGFGMAARFPNSQPWPDVNQLSQLTCPIPDVGDVISNFLGNGQMNLSTGDTLTQDLVNEVELLTNPQFSQDILVADVNLDGNINLLDVAPFIDRLSSGAYQVEADVNCDGAINLLDVAPFVNILAGG